MSKKEPSTIAPAFGPGRVLIPAGVPLAPWVPGMIASGEIQIEVGTAPLSGSTGFDTRPGRPSEKTRERWARHRAAKREG